jgi:Sulfite oxidase and related enzymes
LGAQNGGQNPSSPRRVFDRPGGPSRTADFQAGSRRSTDRLPPGQHLTQGFPILDLGIKPEIALADWRLEIGGSVENPKTFTWEEFNALRNSRTSPISTASPLGANSIVLGAESLFLH